MHGPPVSGVDGTETTRGLGSCHRPCANHRLTVVGTESLRFSRVEVLYYVGTGLRRRRPCGVLSSGFPRRGVPATSESGSEPGTSMNAGTSPYRRGSVGSRRPVTLPVSLDPT